MEISKSHELTWNKKGKNVLKFERDDMNFYASALCATQVQINIVVSGLMRRAQPVHRTQQLVRRAYKLTHSLGLPTLFRPPPQFDLDI